MTNDSDDILDVELDDSTAAEDTSAAAPAPPPPAAAAESVWTWPLVATGIVILLLAPLLYYLLASPQARARRHFIRGVALQTAGQFDQASDEFRQAIDLDPTLAPAAVRLGLALLHLGGVAPDVSFTQEMLRRAMQGDTGPLDAADEAFRLALQMADAARPGRRFPDKAQPGTNSVRANAHACLGLTAVLRASAAIGASNSAAAVAWLREARLQCERATNYAPANPLAALVRSLAEMLSIYVQF